MLVKEYFFICLLLQLDEYHTPPLIAVHLAGLQAQADYGNHDDTKLSRYAARRIYLFKFIFFIVDLIAITAG